MIQSYPVSYRLDNSNEVLEALSYDPMTAITEIQTELALTDCGLAIIAAADLLTTGIQDRAELYKHNAFTTAGIIACGAFMESDAPAELRNHTLSALSMRSAPINLLSDKSEETLRAFEELSDNGHAAHPEFGPHTRIVVEYYTEVTQNTAIGRCAFLGAGYTLYQLDRAWDRARDVGIDKIVKEETAKADWDKLLQ